MSPDSLSKTIRRACRRAGPGRLPGADFRPLGGAYAMATAGLVVVPLLGLAGRPMLDLSAGAALAVFVGLLGITAISGVIVWRLVPEDAPMAGVLAGGLTAVFVAVPGLVGEILLGGRLLPEAPLLLLFSPALLSAVLAGIGHQQLAYPDSEGCLTFDPPGHGIVVRMTAGVFVGVLVALVGWVGPNAAAIVFAVSVTVATFVAAWVAWGVVPEMRFRGAVAGLCTILLAYVLLAFAGPVYVLLANLTPIGGDTFFRLAEVGFFSMSPAELTHEDVLHVSLWIHLAFTAMLVVLLPLGVLLGAAFDRDGI